MSRRIAFTLFGGKEWFGGYNYLLNLLRTLCLHARENLEPVLFVGPEVPDDQLQPLRRVGVEVCRAEQFDASRRRSRLLASLVLGKDTVAETLFRQYRIDAVFEHATYFGWRFCLPTIAWLGDFQHRNLPGMFSVQSYWRRELGMRAQIMSGRALMVSSETAKRECIRYFDVSPERIHVVRFAVSIEPASLFADPEVVRRRYGLPVSYFMVPNQFWKHKNHRLLLEAMTLANSKCLVVSTGYQGDPRHPGHFPSLLRYIEANNLGDRFRMLGIVPLEDVYALMRGAIAVLNPSLSEGWSTTVEEARSLGVPLLLSDIPVHREQMGSSARYVSPYRSDEWADALDDWYVDLHRATPYVSGDVSGANHDRIVRFAREFAELTRSAVVSI